MSSGYIDIHSHILSDIDDGASSADESLEMINALISMGFSTSYATPHNMPGRDQSDLHLKAQTRLNELSKCLQDKGINYELFLGAENYFDMSADIENYDDYFIPLGKSGVYLVEFPFVGDIINHVTKLHETGLKCIIAHAERYMSIIYEPEKVSMLKDAGFIIQMNLGSLIGLYGLDVMKTARYLLEKNMIDIIATDTHNSIHIKELLRKAFKRLSTFIPEEEQIRLLLETPAKLLGNIKI
ncbi:MAG: hypothetical protein M1381_03015 [Deltaproteobacteria bacterium]|nr:hypothetical protein [Deltaproteobacteria bacterium]MCL5791947.1 hypothetical protein [Deltaproteobacteria bacterium]